MLTPDKPVTIGAPLPTYSIVIIDPTEAKLTDPDELGEIGIAGIGLAVGYLNRQDLTDQKFIPDFIGLPNNPSKGFTVRAISDVSMHKAKSNIVVVSIRR